MLRGKTALLVRSAVHCRHHVNGLHASSVLNAKVAVVISCFVYTRTATATDPDSDLSPPENTGRRARALAVAEID